MSKALELNSQNFEQEVLKSNIPVLVDFYADWCGPCQMMAPVLDELAGDMKGKVKIAKVNTEHNQDLASKYQIASIPNMKLFKDGEVIHDFVGFQPKEQLQKEIQEKI